MKTRIISGIVMGIIVVAVVWLGLSVDSIIITAFLAILAAIATAELVGNAAKVENRLCVAVSSIYTALMVFIFCGWSADMLLLVQSSQYGSMPTQYYPAFTMGLIGVPLTLAYFLLSAIIILAKHESFDLSKIAFVCGMPIFYAFAFSTIGSVITGENGIYYLLLIFNYACVCDMGAYFVGVTCGKHKLCPTISPKKTIEGAVGGIASSIIATIAIAAAFSAWENLVLTLVLTIPLCVSGMIGDLFASIIKRKAEIKDYGKLIPGHGGVLDRVDSILFISPLLFCLIVYGAI